jgi:hypothetical protein
MQAHETNFVSRNLLEPRDTNADGVNRTRDLLITNQLLYQLSYVGLFGSIRKNGRFCYLNICCWCGVLSFYD